MTEPRTVVWFSAGAPSAVVAKLTIDTTEYPPEGQNVECDHYGVDSGGTDYYGTSNPPQEWDWNYSYCPKCGVKL